MTADTKILRTALRQYLENTTLIYGAAKAMVALDMLVHDAKQNIFMLEDLPDVLYWYHAESDSCFAAYRYAPNHESHAEECTPIERKVFLEYMENQL